MRRFTTCLPVACKVSRLRRDFTQTSLLALLLLVHPNISLGQAPDAIDADHAVRTLMDQLSQGYFDSFAEKPISRLGDAASVALIRLFSGKIPTKTEIENMMVLMRQAFARPSIIVNPTDRNPATTRFLLNYLETETVDTRLKERLVDLGRLIIDETSLTAGQIPGNLAGAERTGFEIVLPLNLDSGQVQIRYFLTGMFGGYGSFTRSETGKHDYWISTMIDGQIADTFKAAVYAPGCQIETLSVEQLLESSPVADFSCQELPAHGFIGRIAPLSALRGRKYQVEINLNAYRGHHFFGFGDGPVTTFNIARIAPNDDGVFHVKLPDFAQDRVTRSFGLDTADFQFIAREEGTGNILGMLEPLDVQENQHGNLRLRSDYGEEVTFGIRIIQ